MPLDNNKLHKLYSTLQQGGYTQSYDEFEKGFTGNDHYENRKKVYDLLTEHGADIGSSYEEFMGKMQTSSRPQQQSAPAPAPKPKPAPKPRAKANPRGGGMTAAQRAQFIKNAQDIVHNSAAGMRRVKNQIDYANSNRGLQVRPVHLGKNSKVVRRHANGTVAKPRPVFDVAPEQQPGDTYLTESGNEYGSRAEADTEQNAVDQYRYDQSETGQLNNAYAEAERLDKLLEQRGKELDAENQDKWWRDLPRGGGGAVSTMNANDNNGRMNDTEYLNLLAARKKVDEQIRDLKAARDEKTGTFLGGLWRGFRDYTFDLSNWDNGYRDLLTTSAMLRAKTGAAQTPREKASERMMMEDTYKAGEAAQKAEKVLGNGYRFMRIGAQSLPFALQFMAGNAMGMTGGIARAGEGMGVKLARKIAIKQGANNMMRNIGRSVLKNTGVALGDLGAATALSTTVQAAQTGADIGHRYAGDVVYDPKTDDYKLEGGKSLGRSIYEGVANSAIENYTEMLGEHMHLGKFASSALTKMGLGRVSNWFTKVGKTDFMQGVNKYMNMAGFNGYPQEVMEEEVGIPLHAIFDGGNKMSDLIDGRQQLDIVGGMLFSMAGMGGASMAMQGGHKAAMAVQYHQDQHKLDNADKVASFRLTADKWAPIKEEIDGTTNEDFGKTMKNVLSNDELSDQEKQAVWDYAQRLIIMRGHNMGQEAATRNGMTDKETNTANESYTQGYNTTDPAAMNDAKNRLAAAQQKLDGIFGENTNAQQILDAKKEDGSPYFTANDRKAAQAVVNAKQEYEGMMQRVRDDIDDEVQQTGAIYDSRTNDNGVIQSATLKAQNPDGTDRKVYITSGNVVMTDDGKSVDREKSDMSVVVVDDEGKVQMISPDEIFSLDAPLDGEQAKQQAIDAIKQSKAQEAADKINGKVDYTAGNTYTLTDSKGQQIEATLVADQQTGAVENPDGSVNVSMGGKVVPMAKDTFQQMVDATNMQRTAQGDEEAAADQQTDDADAQQQPTEQAGENGNDDASEEGSGVVPSYPGSVVAPSEPHQWQMDDTFVIDNGGVPVRGQVTGIDADGVEIYTESPINGKKMQVVSPEELQSMTTEINGETVQGQEDAAAMQQPTQPVDGEQTGDNGSNGVNGEQPQGQAEPLSSQAEPQQTEGQQPQRAIDRIPSQQVDDGKGNVRTVHNWEQAEPGDTYDALTEIYHGNADRVKKGVQNRISAIDKQIKATQKQMDAIDNSDDFDAVAAQGEQYDQLQKQKETLEQQRKYWQSVQNVPVSRRAEQDKRTEEEKAAAKAERAKAEAEALEKARQERERVNGVPDVINDTPSDARQRGFRNVNGMVVNRQGNTEGVTGRESSVKFSSKDTTKGKVKVIEADQLQPSHVNGQRNPQFFIDEAQPKDRTDTVSSMAAAKIASNLNPEEIPGDGSAYQFSAPTVNSRGEVIQGNNRSDALKLMYSTPAFKPAQDAYKQYIIDHAADFGFTPEDVEKIKQMQHPVMVNELGVDDDEAIRLGQMKASDNESGGIERIDPVTTSQKLGAKVGSYANILLSSPDEDASLSDVLMQNGAKTVHWLSQNGIISNTAAQSAFDRKGNLTPEARMDLLNILKQSLFQGGVSDLPAMFDKMPAKAQKAILNTFMRDFDSAESERILPEIQKAIEAWYGCAMSNEAFAKAPNYKAAKAAMHDWTLQTNLLDDNMPSDKFSNFAMELACRLQGCSMRETQQSLNDFFDLVQGKSQGDLFGGTTLGEQADRQEAIKRIFNIEYKPIKNKNNGKNGSNAVADDNSQSGEGRPGSTGDGAGRERAAGAEQQADVAGGTEGNDEKGKEVNKQPIGSTSSPEHVKTEREAVNTEPTEKQKEAGNYKKGHIKVDGFDITIENPKGSTRSGTDASGKAWSVPMHYDYGYIKGTEGVDGDHIDVYLSDNPTSGNVYVVDQIDQKTGKFDEHKVMYGFPSKEAAVEAYKTQYEKGWKVGPVTEVSREDFKKWVESSKRKTKPFSEYKSVKDAAAMQQPTEQSGKQKPEEKPKAKRTTAKKKANAEKPKKANAGQFGLVSDERMEELKKRLRAKLNNLNMGVDPEVLAIGLELTAGYIDRGVKKFAEYSKAMINDLGDVVRPYLKAFYNGVRDMPEITGNGLDKEMDDYDTVSKFNVATIGKDGDDVHPSILDTAEQVSNESHVAKEAQNVSDDDVEKEREKGKMEMHEVDTDRLFNDLKAGKTATLSDYYKDKGVGEGFDLAIDEAHDRFLSQLYTFKEKPTREMLEAALKDRDKWIDELAAIFKSGKSDGIVNGKHVKNVDVLESLANMLGQRKALQELIDKGTKAGDAAQQRPTEQSSHSEDSNHSNDSHIPFPKGSSYELKGGTVATIKDIIDKEHRLVSFDAPGREDSVISVSMLQKVLGTNEKKANEQPVRYGSRGFTLRPARQEDFEGHTPFYVDGKQVHAVMLVRTGEQVSATQFSAPRVEAIYTTTNERIPVEKLEVEDVPKTVHLKTAGNFLEAYGNDAVALGRATGVTIIENDGQKMAGFPKNYLDEVEQNLRDAGFDVSVDGKATKAATDNILKQLKGAPTAKTSTAAIKNAMSGKKTEAKKNNEKKKVVSSQQKEKEPSLFDELFDDNSTNQKQAEDGLQRNDELRPEGLPSDSDHPGEHSERQGQGPSQGREGSDRERKGTGVRGVLGSNEQPVRSGERLNQHNNHAERGKDYAPTGVDDRIEANIAAIEMLHKITDEGRQATPSEMKVLRRFSGWGGLGKAFKEPEWGARNPYYNRLKALLSDEEWQEAEMSRNSAYFTPATVIDNLWDIARALGFKGGNVLEGSAGIGNIIGLMPTDMSERSHIQAVEIDSTTGGILRLLYPDAKTDIQGFEQTKVRNGSVDLAITNVPFVTGLHVNDTTGDKDLSRKFGDIHDFCIAKNVRKLKPGGIGIFITSSGTMDKSQKLRDWLVNDGDADVIGAFRMNNETFGGTSATSDIIVVRKRVDGKKSPMAIDVSKVGVERMGTYHDRLDGDKELPVDYNQYFIDHPENMGGKMYLAGEKGDTYRPSSKSLYPVGNISQKKRMEAWVKSLGDMYASAQRQAAEQGEDAAQNGSAQNLTDDAQESTVYDTLGDDVKEGSMLVDKQGRLCVATYGEAVPLSVNSNKVKGHTKVECFNAYKRIKDAVKKVLDYQTQHDDNKGLQPLLAELNNAYDTFVNTYGHLNKNTAISFLKNDMDFSGTAALEGFEEYNDKNGKRLVKYTKSDIFSQRVVEKESEPHPTTVKDGVITSIYKNGRIDLGYIAGELGKSREEVKQSILDEGLGFEDPVSGETVVSYEYLSGNVREKLHQAEAQNEGGRYDANIKALQKVIPMNIPSHLIEYSLGSSWLDPELYEQYIEEKTGIKVKARNIDGTWAVSAPSYGLSNEKNRMLGVTSSLVGKTVFGHELIIAAMKNTSIVVQKTEKSYDGHTETITDKEATRLCGEKIDEIRQDFKDWARGKMQQDPDLSKKYEDRYNDQFNNYVPKEIPDSFVPMYFSGATHKIVLRPHQAKAAIRGTTQNVLLAHEVGSGKTFTLISTAMEMRRLGTARKPMVVVQNATVGQFVSSAKFLYPNAKILTIESKDRNAEGRKAFYAKIKYNDWDMVVIPQSVLDMIPDSEERQLAFVQAKIAEKEQVLRQMSEADVDDPIMMRRAQKELKTLQEEMNTLSEQVAEKKKDSKKAAVARQNAKVRAEQMLDRKVDDVANFDNMGIDALLVDEAHEYKHLGFATAMQRGVKGVDPSYSKKCQGLYLKCQSVMEKTGGKNIIFATGTPISNTAAEIWTFMKYLMPEDMMKDYGIYYFDDFVRNFGDISQIPEFNTAGKFVQNNRFKGYQNLPELVRIWSGVSDTVLSSEIADLQAKIPQMQGGKAQDIYLPQTRALRSIMKYVRAQLKDYENMSGKEKKEHSALPLMMYGIAKAAAVDPRLVQSDAEDDEHSKTNACVKETLKALDESKKYQGTVAIFADNYQNKHSGFNLFDDIKQKLVKSGVPEKQIVVIKPGMTVEKKTAIFDKVNAGEVRVVLGTTATLGTGVNMQERLYTLIHLDAPNRPMDYTQRNGRILRQGNLHKEWNIPVKVIRFGVEDSLDVTAYQRLKTKGAIADSIMHGKDLMSNSMENRTIEEEEDQFGDTVAQLSGSEYALLKQQAERELRKYEGKKKQWEADQVYIHSQKPRLEGQIEAAKKRSRESADALDALSKSKEKGIVVGKKRFAGVDAMGDFIKDFNKKVKASEDDIRSHKSESADHVLDVTVDGHTFKVRLHLYKDMGESRGNLFEVVKRKMTYSCAELSLSDIPVKGSLLRNALEDIEQNVVTGNDFRDRKERAEAEADRLTKELTMIKSREGKQFEYGEQLEAAKQKVDEYTKKMKAELDEKEKKYAEMDKEVATSNLDDQSQDDDVLYRIEDDPEELDRLDKEPKVKVYRAMQLIDGKLYPPMAAKVNGSLVEPAEPGQWLRADEHPELAKNGLFTLNKGGKDASGKRLGSVPAAYNPYWHTSRSPLNDQFSSAYKRPNLVTVEVEIPKSELTSGYHADGAKDPVGEMSWHAGPVSSKLPKEKERKVILSRWCKVVRVVPDAEVADKVAGMLKGENISVPDNTVTPSLRRELEKRGVPITHTKMVEDWERKYPSTQSGLSRDGNGAYSDDELSMINDPFVKMLGEKARTAKQRKAFAARERSSMAAAVKELAEKLHLDNVEIRSAAQQLTEQATKQERRKARAKGYYDRKSGTIVINIDNHRDVEDAVQTLLHEAVAHYGLRQLFGSHFDTFLDNVYKAADMDVRQRITDLALRKYKGDFHVATEEYLASLAENTNFEHMPDSFWSKIKALFLKMLHSIGFDGFAGMGVTLSDNELRYILWRSYENLKEPGRYRSILGEAEDVSKQAELKVGNYGVTSVEPRRTERGNVAESSLNGVSEPEAWGKNDLLSKAEQVSHGIDPGLLFRDTIEDDDYTARETYNRMADEKKNVVREAWQDSMINVRNLQEAVLKQRGEKMEDWEDAYNEENRSHGKSRAESEYFTDNLYKPLLKAVNAVAKAAKVSVGDVTEYMMAKHGLERNVVFASRDAQKAYDTAMEKAKGEYDALMNAAQAESDPKKKDALEKRAQKVKFPDYNDLYLHFRQRDYSGLTSLTGQSDAQDAEVEAQRIVTDMESRAAVNGSAQNGLIDELWKATNAATEWTLRKAYESGMMSRDNYDYVRSMFNNYIPLRGWEEDTAGDLYDYVGSGDKGTAFSPTLHKAKGRRSQADNPIAYIGSMAVSAIVQGNKKKVKQTFMRFAENHPTNLVTVSEMWYRNFGTDTAPDWREDVPYIPEDATADEIAAIVKQHEDDMEQLEAQGMATKQRGRLHLGVPVKKGQALEHHVEVMVNGKKYVLYINGNPRAAQALNGTRMRRSSERSFESSKIATIGRKLSERYTSLSPSFTVSNMFRDLTMAAISTAIKESPAYALRFRLNVARLGGPARMFPLMRWYRKAVAEQLPMGQMSGIKRYFYEFMTQGAETGFTSLKEIDTYKDDMQKMYKHMNQSMANPKRLLRGLSEGLEYTNRCIEDMTRFATYMTSRQSGRSVRESVSDAKTITLNFNRKGSGELGNSTYRNLQIFVNPAIQSLQNVASMAMDHPVKFSLYTGMVALIGAAQVFATQLLWSMFGGGDGDDDNWNAVDEYWKLPTWQRRNNLVMWIPGTKKFAMIPLAQEFRVFHGFGETLTTTLQGKSDESPALELMSQTADLLPLDFAGNNGNMLVNLAPTVVQPLLQVRFNTDFTGRPLYKDNSFNKYEPSFQKAYVGTPSWLVKSSEFLNDLTGGDEHMQGWWERTNIGQYANNPAVVDHLLKGYLGGMYSFFAQTGGAMLTAASGKLPDVQEVPVANRVVTAVRETEQGGKQKLPDWYYDLSEENARHQNEFSGYKKDYMTGDADGQKKFNELINSKDFQKWQKVNTYIGAVQQIRTAMNYTKDPKEKAELEESLAEVLGELKKMKDE